MLTHLFKALEETKYIIHARSICSYKILVWKSIWTRSVSESGRRQNNNNKVVKKPGRKIEDCIQATEMLSINGFLERFDTILNSVQRENFLTQE
jgi:hypothetical protein